MNKNFLFIANWKMYTTFNESIAFITKNHEAFLRLSQQPNTTIVLCPSATAYYPFASIFKESSIEIGAQDCSDHHRGAFTGQISAEDLQSVGCSYCIIGHSERRRLNNESNVAIAQKLTHLLDTDIIPIICIGETEEQNKQNKTLTTLEQQLTECLEVIQQRTAKLTSHPIVIAYEPVWAIGSGVIPNTEHLETVFAWLSQHLLKQNIHAQWALTYGGSVTSASAHQLKKIKHLDGFLIGGASLDFQEFEKIVKCNIKS
jgi:triosephosphate isomerase